MLYDIAERIRFELLGVKILKGISKNLKENYSQKLSLKRKDQLKTKEDVNVAEAFELYMLKNFFDIKLNPLSNKILSFWEKEFNSSLNKHINFLSKNIENQEKYNSKFSKILQEMDIFEAENEKNENDKNEDEQDNNLENNDQKQSKETQEKSKQDENQNGIDGNYDLEKYELDEQLIDTESENQSSENVSQKTKNNIQDNDYKIFTNEFIYTWADMNSSLFSALKVERNVMFIILSLIIIVAAFNIISGLTILVKNKTKDIAILKSIGVQNKSITKIFFFVGVSIGTSATITITACQNFSHWLENE